MNHLLDSEPLSPSKSSSDDAAPDFAQRRGQKRELVEELRSKRQNDLPVCPEELLQRWPTDPKSDPDVASLLFEDFRQRELKGDGPSIREYQKDFPEHAGSLARLFDQEALLRSVGLNNEDTSATLRLPSVGDEVFRFHLCQEMGSGAFARVYLATQIDLAQRPVVLKVSKLLGNEPQTLAQMQHTHIVPIFSFHDDSLSGLRAVCMPFYGGNSLARVLEPLWEKGQAPVHGMQLIEALASIGTYHDSPRTAGRNETERESHRLLRTTSYVRAAVWIVARLAEGLAHAHQCGVLHRDIKPSNILLGSDGQPMLLDFNLSQDLNSGEAQAAAALGGTVAYMAPEHLRAMLSRDNALASLVDERADIYSLGMVLYEMLAGHGPFKQSASYTLLPVIVEAMILERSQNVPSLRARRPDAPWGLESILRMCMAPDAAKRYQRAEHLAEDLQAFLDNKPLRYAPELSKKERLQKWARRHPRLTSSGSVGVMASILLLGTGAGLVAAWKHIERDRAELANNDASKRLQDHEKGTVRALYLVNTTTGLPDRPGVSNPGLDHLRQGMAVCEETLGLYDVLGRDNWEQHDAWLRLKPDDRNRLSEDTRELLLLLAWARVQTWQRQHAAGDAAGEREDIYRGALALLDKAEAIPNLASSSALWMDRGHYLQELGDAAGAQAAYQKARAIEPASARDHYLLAAAQVRNRPANDLDGQRRATEGALQELNKALQLNPKHYWTWIQRGICYLELNQPDLAAGDFGVCIGLWPENAWGYFNRGCANDRNGRKLEAIADYSAALERDKDLLLAYRNRGIARLELQQYADALADIDLAISEGLDEMALHAGRGVALEKMARSSEADAAFQEAWARLVHEPEDARLRFRWVYAFAVAKRLPDKAAKVFEEVVAKDPLQVQGWYGLAMLAADQGKTKEAIGYFDRALEVEPGFIDARRFRAVLLARDHQIEAATRDINLCLEKEPRAGITLYAAACVAALAAEQSSGTTRQAAITQCLSFLRKAFEAGYGRDKALTDPDLTAVRQNPEFRQLLAQ